MEIEGKLRITFNKDLNKFKQRPLTISFVGPDGIQLDVVGVRFKEGQVLEAMAALPGGKPVYHTHFSPALQSAVREARQKEPL